MLPELPKQHKQKEADFGVQFLHWIESNPLKTSAFEVKHTRGKDRFLLSELGDKQISYANKIESDKGVLIRVQGLNGEPDYIYLRKEPAFVVIKYPKFSCVIRASKLQTEKENTKSLTSERAREIADVIL